MTIQSGVEALARNEPVRLTHPESDRLRDRIAYAVAGPERAPLVTLIPGGSGAVASSAMASVWREMSTDYRVLIVETRGAPSVRMEPTDFSTRDIAEDVVELLDELGLHTTHVLGASLGSMIAQHVVADLGDRCSSAVLALSTAGNDAFFSELMMHLAHIARTDPAEATFAATLWASGADGFGRWSALLPPRSSGNTPQTALEGLAMRYEAAARHDAYDRLTSLPRRTLVLAAGNDLMLRPALGREMAGQIAHATFEVWDGATHLCINEDPQRFAARCVQFLGD